MTEHHENLTGMGNIGSYVAKEHFVQPFEPLIVPGIAAVKLYSMRSIPKHSEPFSKYVMDNVRWNVKDMLSGAPHRPKILPRRGFGFAVVSDAKNDGAGYVNVAMFGDNHENDLASLLRNNLFMFEYLDNKGTAIEEQDIREMGTYCVWEEKIVAHESSAWRAYLFSQQKERDKIKYLCNTFSGIVK